MTNSKISTITLDNKIIQQWLEVLRDPIFIKAKRQLENKVYPIQRCCLGHLCYAAKLDRDVVNKKVFYTCQGSTSTNYIPSMLARALDITIYGTFLRKVKFGKKEYSSLVQLNDKSRISLPKMADIIEENICNKNFDAYQTVL